MRDNVEFWHKIIIDADIYQQTVCKQLLVSKKEMCIHVTTGTIQC